jgi:hypothetical protein
MKKSIRGSSYAKWAFHGITRTGTRSMVQSFDRLRRHIRGSDEPSFSHLYLEDLDSVSHRHGPDADGVGSLILRIDRELSILRDESDDGVRLIVTADHGHITVDPNRHHLLREGDALLDLLEIPPSGESRNPLFHVIEGREAEFKERFIESYGKDFYLASPDEIEAEGIMGPTPLSDLTRERLGTFVGIAKGPGAIEYIPAGRESKRHKSMHGGLSSDEIEVSLFLA